ncbi:uncharacterized protein LOC143820546 [Paroedura picta]|uniref:uncharacterized protein LOC143820546 n=1 Tax=Paroedura picta TaxID=143630 RepID=UPI004055ABC5
MGCCRCHVEAALEPVSNERLARGKFLMQKWSLLDIHTTQVGSNGSILLDKGSSDELNQLLPWGKEEEEYFPPPIQEQRSFKGQTRIQALKTDEQNNKNNK